MGVSPILGMTLRGYHLSRHWHSCSSNRYLRWVCPAITLNASYQIELDCFPEMLTIAAMMSVENLWVIPRQKVEDAQTKHMAFKSKHGDLLTTLVV